MLEGKNTNQSENNIGSMPISFIGDLFRRKIFQSKNGISLNILCVWVFLFISQCSSAEVREDQRNLLYNYAKQDNLEGVRSAINQGGLEPREGTGYIHVELALNHASKLKNTSILQLLLENGVNPNLNNGKKKGPALSHASKNCNLEAVKLLIKYGADVDYEYEPHDGAGYLTKAYIQAILCENKQSIHKILKNPSLAMDKNIKGNSQLSSADFTETITLKNGQTIKSVKTKIAGDTIVVDYPNGNTKVYKKTEVKGVERN